MSAHLNGQRKCAKQPHQDINKTGMLKDFKPIDLFILCCISIAGLGAALHIIFGGRNVVEALTTATAAAWIQAVGAIAAIGIAIWVSNKSERHAQRCAEIVAIRFIQMAEDAVGGLVVACSVDSEEASVQRSRFVGELREVQLIGQSISLGNLPKEICALVVEARTVVARCVALSNDLQQYRRRFPHPDEGLNSYPRDGHTIAYALLKSSWKSLEELAQKSKTL